MGKADSSGTYYLLNMGETRYGDCVVCKFGDKTILIDGGHKGDFDGQEGYPSLPDQLESILGQKKNRVDLLVVTHCHDDHIGCLPELVDTGLVTADWALVTDEKWGFGRVSERDGADTDDLMPGLDDRDPDIRRIVAALCEEDYSDAKPDEIEQILADAETVESRYLAMLSKLKKSGTKIIRHGRDKVPAPFTKAFESTGLTIIGPTREHLEICSKALARFVRNAASAARSAKESDADLPLPDLYRQLASSGGLGDDTDMAGTSGPPRNNMSIVLAFGGDGNRALFGGDMQFAKPEVSGLNAEMQDLRKAVEAAGPYDIVKTLHHTSYNGQDENVLAEWGSPKLLAHSGGRHDPNHPDKGALSLLRAHRSDFDFARTDRNGIVQINAKGFETEGGKLNDFSLNTSDDAVRSMASGSPPARAAEPSVSASEMQFIVARIPYGPTRITIDGIEIVVEPLGSRTESTQPKAVEPANVTDEKKKIVSKLASGRTVPPLLFVVDADALAGNIGAAESGAALAAIRDAGQTVLQLSSSEKPVDQVRKLIRDDKFKGVVLLGGYDAIPSMRLDVLPPELRTKLGDDTTRDPDNFIVWSDAVYGDRTGNGLADLPVSRIPDGHDAELVFAALGAADSGSGQKFGVRNARRPFADLIWKSVPGGGALAKSAPFSSDRTGGADFSQSYLYFMLHGSAEDGSVYLGETPLDADATVEAFRASQLANARPLIALSGCCWGALVADRMASEAGQPQGRRAEDSIALTLLKKGALGIVGCTGCHYSPDETGAFFGGPLQQSFWAYIKDGKLGPSEALFRSKVDFIRALPHGRTDAFELAIELKIVREFTCLGLGW